VVSLTLGAAVFCGCGPSFDIVAKERPAEVCDGVDNDGNGIIDDVDADHDGMCDCLRAGVLGYPGDRAMSQLQDLMHGRAVATARLAGQELTPALLSELDVVIVQDVQDGEAAGTIGKEGIGVGIGRAYSAAEVQALQDWVVAGGGLMALSGYTGNTGEVTNANRLLAPFQMSYGTEFVLPAGGSSRPVTHWESSHPLANGVTQVGIDSGHSVSGGTLVAWEPTRGAYDVGRAEEWSRGHVFVWADDWITYDSDWNIAQYQNRRLWLNSFKWLATAGYCQVPIP